MQGLKLNYSLYVIWQLLLCIFTEQAVATPSRIVSLAPSITETIYALGAADSLVGVTRYCDYPEEAKKLADVGGLFDPSIESIYGLRPDLVILQKNENDISRKLEKLKLNTLSLKQESLADILSSITEIAKATNKVKEAEMLIKEIKNELRNAKNFRFKEKKTVAIVIGKSVQTGFISKIFLAGNNTFYKEMINLFNAELVYRGSSAYPQLSYEGLLSLNPDFIIDLAPEIQDTNKELLLWKKLAQLHAVKEDKVFVTNDPQMVHPGPRIGLIAKEFAKILGDAR